jgi:AraC-like DNA-binding protein
VSERVRIWRPDGGPRLLAMHGTTTAYAIDPDGTYVLGLVVRGGFRAGGNLDRNVTLDELATAAGISRFRVSRLFTAGFGLPPHRFQLAQRLRLARRLLERGTDPTEAAACTGFFDQSHLHRHFVRTIGTTPGRYAAAFASPR